MDDIKRIEMVMALSDEDAANALVSMTLIAMLVTKGGSDDKTSKLLTTKITEMVSELRKAEALRYDRMDKAQRGKKIAEAVSAAMNGAELPDK